MAALMEQEGTEQKPATSRRQKRRRSAHSGEQRGRWRETGPVCVAPAPARVNHKGADVGGGAGASVGLRTGGVCCARLRSGISQATRWWVRVGAAGWPVRVQVQARVRQAGTHPWWVRRREWVRVRMRVQVWRRVCV